MKSGKFNLLFIVSSYVNSLELYVTHIVFYQNQFDLRIIPIVEKGIVNNILVIPVDFSLSRDQIVEQFSTILHEMSHIEGALKSDFTRKPPALIFRGEYEAYKMGICATFWANAYSQNTLDDNKLKKAKLEIKGLNARDSYGQAAEHLHKLANVPDSILLSTQARALVLDNFDLFNLDFCESVFKEGTETAKMLEMLILLKNAKFDVFSEIREFN